MIKRFSRSGILSGLLLLFSYVLLYLTSGERELRKKRKKILRTGILWGLVLLSAFALSSCSLFPKLMTKEEGTAALKRPLAKAIFKASFDEVWSASVEVMVETKHTIKVSDKTGGILVGDFLAYIELGIRNVMTVTLLQKPEGQVEVTCRLEHPSSWGYAGTLKETIEVEGSFLKKVEERLKIVTYPAPFILI